MYYKEKENQKVQLVCQSSVSWYVPELRLKRKLANSFHDTSIQGELITQRLGGERINSIDQNCECFSLTLFSIYTLSSSASSLCGFCDFAFHSGACWVTHIPLWHSGGIGDDIKDKGERKCGISRDKLRTRAMSPCTQPREGSHHYRGEC